MSTTAWHEHHNKHHLPPSPPPSPLPVRRRQRKRQDSFEKLANTPSSSPPASLAQESLVNNDRDSWLGRIILTPVLFVSFILSLSFVNLRDRANRKFANSNTSFFTYLYPSSWLDPEPYQDPSDSKWGQRGQAGHVEPGDAINPNQGGQVDGVKKKKETWYLNKKIRKMAKLEVSDALEMRGKVMAGVCAIMVIVTMMLWIGIKWLVASLVRFS